MKVAETFLSIQGEGPRTGRPCFFIRAAGCNLDCEWCDTPYARDPSAVEMRPDELVRLYLDACRPFGDRFRAVACLTGGEPMLQPDTPDLLRDLLLAGVQVDLMTNGTCSLDSVPLDVGIVVDLKVSLLSCGGHSSHPASYPAPAIVSGGRPGRGDCVKFVVAGRADFDVAAEWAHVNDMFNRVGNVYVAPAWGLVEPADLAGWIMTCEPRFRLGLQTHKYIWGPYTRL